MILNKIKNSLEVELKEAKSIWVASAMITKNGWDFMQEKLPKTATQNYLIGVDLATSPLVFESILSNLEINARIYKNPYTFHPKVYIIQKKDKSLTAFIGSSNTTTWGLEKNVEMNFQVNDQTECKNLIKWFKSLYNDGYLITQDFIDSYKTKHKKALDKLKEVKKDSAIIKKELSKDKNQFFSTNQHEIFKEKYHQINSDNLKDIRKSVRDRFLELHNEIYPLFNKNGLTDLHCHHQSRERVSRHYFNPFSGKYINAMWLHYGKSHSQLLAYPTKDEKSFIHNIRIQVIIHEDSLGIWLVLGKDWGSVNDRNHFRKQMKDSSIQKKFFTAFKLLGNDYWINISKTIKISDIKTTKELVAITNKEKLDDYFIIGRNINWLDSKLSTSNITNTILGEFKKLYPLYEIMRHIKIANSNKS